MKKLEITLLILAVVSIPLSFMDLPGGYVLRTLSFLALAAVYLLGSVKIFTSNENIERKVKPLVMAAGVTLFALIIGFFFKLSHLPGSAFISFLGFVSSLVVAILLLLKVRPLDRQLFGNIILRFIFCWLLFLSIMAIPQATWLKWEYPDYPDYIEATLEYSRNPNEVTYQKMQEQGEIMREHKKAEK